VEDAELIARVFFSVFKKTARRRFRAAAGTCYGLLFCLHPCDAFAWFSPWRFLP
jgi:hypothetical protein